MKLDAIKAFRSALEKEASPFRAVGRFLSESPMRTALLGAGVGAAGGALTAQPGEGAEGALRGAIGGAVLGGTVGGAGRAFRDTRLLANRPLGLGETIAETGRRLGHGLEQGVKRQIHGLTGAYADPAQTGIRSSHTAAQRVRLLEARARDQLRGANPDQAAKIRSALAESIAAAQEEGRQGDAALRAGVTSLPGVVRGLAGPNRLETLKALGREATGHGGLLSLGGTLGVGLPVVSGAADIAAGDESAAGGRSLAQKVVGAGTNVGVGALTSGMPFLSGMAITGAADTLGQALARPKLREVAS